MKRVLFVIVLLLVASGMTWSAEAQEVSQAPYTGASIELNGWHHQLYDWAYRAEKIPAANIPPNFREAVRDVASDLQSLDAREPSQEERDPVRLSAWLMEADLVTERLTHNLALMLLFPQTTASRRHLQQLAEIGYQVQRDLRISRRGAYLQVREVPKEVVRTVEVPAQCPALPSRLDPAVRCDRQLHQGSIRWATIIHRIIGMYGNDGSGRGNEAFRVLGDVRREINQLPADASDMVPLVISWERRLSSAANDKANTEGMLHLSASEQSQINALADDMRTQLQFCRHY